MAVPKEPVDRPRYAIRTLGDTELRLPAARVDRVDDRIRDLCRDMLRSMYTAKGIGLAAPQVGVNKQVIVIDLDPETPKAAPMVLINPTIIAEGAAVDSCEEGCLSIPGVYLNVVRPTLVEVAYQDEAGRRRRIKADGLLGRCIQHEMDHLKGVLFVDRVTDTEALSSELQEHGFPADAVHAIR
ncbi:MAG: peptide deformylase [Aphanocapsa feldmannii 288cV]|nr:MAG: peptide deformylase [Aphanocapsa feldmannii 288cV]